MQQLNTIMVRKKQSTFQYHLHFAVYKRNQQHLISSLRIHKMLNKSREAQVIRSME